MFAGLVIRLMVIGQQLSYLPAEADYFRVVSQTALVQVFRKLRSSKRIQGFFGESDIFSELGSSKFLIGLG